MCRRLRIIFLAVALAPPSTLWAQYVTGTVVVLEDGGDYIVIATDSLRLGPSPGQVSQTACKIAKLSDQLVFAASGISSHQDVSKTSLSETWNVDDIARREYSVLATKHVDHLVQKLAAAYGESLADRINHDLKRNPKGPLLSYIVKEGAGTAVFAGFDEQHHRVIVEVKVGVLVPGDQAVGYSTKPLPGGDDTMEAEVVGDTTIAGELAAGRTERSRGWRSTISLRSTGLGLRERLLFEAQYVAELTAQYDPDHVGGPIDVILVTRRQGVTWVHRKLVCRPAVPVEKSVGGQR